MADEQVTLSLEASRLTDKTQEKCERYFIEVCDKNIYKRMNVTHTTLFFLVFYFFTHLDSIESAIKSF